MADDADAPFSAPPEPPPKRRNAVLLLFDAPLYRDWAVWSPAIVLFLYALGTVVREEPSQYPVWMDFAVGPALLVCLLGVVPAWLRLQFRRWRWRRWKRANHRPAAQADGVRGARPSQDVLGKAPKGLGITASDPSLVGIDPTVAGAMPAVHARVRWSALDADGFERFLARLLSQSGSYGRISRLMDVNAADGGRDIQAYRRVGDGLIGERWERVVVQAKHWPKRGVAASEIADLVHAKLPLWEGEPIRGLIIATTGSFTQDAVRWVDDHNRAAKRPDIVLWSRNELEILLWKWPSIAEEYGLSR